ncbi:CpsD/CapB family tyrosine-protein kinase [Butyrivibrio fibrisolvens]|uniref:CpsD/CapB family tyrosine-protein kinase n=1 Tax=Butyrivibrio fibrisolvens TaxID=831 RepID=UPI000418AC8E|nr:CpsD/CapB family tyrosine-protein kinase [Butyrivibrio fibrisolvens]
MIDIELETKNLPFGMTEEVKNLRTSIAFAGDGIKSVLFTSTMTNEGKSTITIEAARSFAELGKKVVLVDTDLRKSILKMKIVSGKMKYGLTHYLSGQCEVDDIIYHNTAEGFDNMYIVPTGPATKAPTELLSTNKLGKLLDDLRNDYDMVIIDTPPVGTVIDAAIIAPHADGAVFIVESGKVNYKSVQKAIEKFEASGCKVLGVALNKVDKSKNSYGYYKYGKDYGYNYGYGVDNI